MTISASDQVSKSFVKKMKSELVISDWSTSSEYSETKQLNRHDLKRIKITLSPLLDESVINLLYKTWGTSRPKNKAMKEVHASFLLNAQPKIWLSKTGLKIIRSCDERKSTFIKKLTFCFHYQDLETICEDFQNDLQSWIKQLKNYPLSVKSYDELTRIATRLEILHREKTISISKPLNSLSKGASIKNLLEVRKMLRKLWLIRHIHRDHFRPIIKNIKSVCKKEN